MEFRFNYTPWEALHILAVFLLSTLIMSLIVGITFSISTALLLRKNDFWKEQVITATPSVLTTKIGGKSTRIPFTAIDKIAVVRPFLQLRMPAARYHRSYIMIPARIFASVQVREAFTALLHNE